MCLAQASVGPNGEGAVFETPYFPLPLVPFAFAMWRSSAHNGVGEWRAAALPSLLPQTQPSIWQGEANAGTRTSVQVVKLGQEAQMWPSWPESNGRDGLSLLWATRKALGGSGFNLSSSLPAFWLWLQKPLVQNEADGKARPGL